MAADLDNTTITRPAESWQSIDARAFQFEQLNMLYRQLSFILLADVVTSIFLFLILFFTSYNPLSVSWLVALLATSAARAVFAQYHRTHRASPEFNQHRRNFVILGACLSGLLWGSVVFVLPPSPSFLQVALIGLWLAGLLAGAATTMAVMKEVFLAFALPSSLILLGYFTLSTPEYRISLGGGFLTYLAFLTPIALRINTDFTFSITLKLRNRNLQEMLIQEAARLNEKEEELMLQRRKQATLQSQKAHIDAKLKAADVDRLLLLDAIQEGIYGVNSLGTVTFINQSALKILAYNEDDVIGRSVAHIIHPTQSRPENNNQANQVISNCYLKGVAAEGVESVFFGYGTRKIPVRFSCQPIRKLGNVIGAVVSFADISHQKEMEFMLIQSQKMEAIGRLTGGVSHDFNNLLTVIMGNLQFLQNRLASDEQSKTLVNKIMNAAKSGAELNNRLLSFSREQALESSPTDIREMLLEMSEFLDRILGEEIQLELNLMDESCVVMTDRTQLENAILNLCVNARDAMPQGGKLSITARTSRLAESYVGHATSDREIDYVELVVTDTGTGIPESIQKQIFEPFFTTKEKHQGTGLGLSTVYGFLRQSGGNITVSSRVGEGATFHLYLPLMTEPVRTQRELPDAENQDAETHYEGRILVVEDNANVREVACQMLTDAGYEVITADNGPAGLRMFQENPDVDLVFSDVIMPGGMTGIDMAEEILKLRPDKPILLTTGYTEKALKDRILEFKNIVCVSKPYDTNKLPKYVHSMMQKGLLEESSR